MAYQISSSEKIMLDTAKAVTDLTACSAIVEGFKLANSDEFVALREAKDEERRKAFKAYMLSLYAEPSDAAASEA